MISILDAWLASEYASTILQCKRIKKILKETKKGAELTFYPKHV